MVDSEEKQNLYCSFCGKHKDQVEELIQGQNVFICNECVDLCNDIIKEKRERQLKIGNVYKHYKGGYYKVVLLSRRECDGAGMVSYENEDGEIWTQQVKRFHGHYDGGFVRIVRTCRQVCGSRSRRKPVEIRQPSRTLLPLYARCAL